MRFKKIRKLFEEGNVCVVGLRRRGKDMLFANVVSRRKLPYISNTDYKASCSRFYPLELDKLDCGKNTYQNFIEGNLNYYSFPYPDGTDVYIGDCGVYFPAQYCNELNKRYGYISTFMALSAQLGKCNVHVNCQNLNRIYDKLREQCDTYVTCNRCIYLFGFVIETVTIYDKYESCANRVEPFRMRLPLFAKKEMKNLLLIEKEKYRLQHGSIRRGTLFFFNRSKYNTRIFKEILENGRKEKE